jgi:hypothetical protein
MPYADCLTISRPLGIWFNPENSRICHSKMTLARCRALIVWQYAGLLGYGFNLKTAEYVIPKWYIYWQDTVGRLSDIILFSKSLNSTPTIQCRSHRKNKMWRKKFNDAKGLNRNGQKKNSQYNSKNIKQRTKRQAIVTIHYTEINAAHCEGQCD